MNFGRNWPEPPRSPQALSKRSMAISLLRAWTLRSCKRRASSSLKPALERIAALNDSKDIATLIGDLAAAGDPAPLFGLDVEPDPKDSKKPILSISQGGLTLPDRETYGGNSRYIVKRYEAT